MANTPNNDKHAREDEYAAKVIGRERERQEKRKNGLPPFLMARSGLLNGWLVTVALLLLVASVGNRFAGNLLCDISSGIVGFSGTCYGIISSKRKYKIFKHDIKIIKDAFDSYIKRKNYSIDLHYAKNQTMTPATKDLDKIIYSPKLARILIRDIAEHNPYVFDKMIANPDTITDSKIKSHVISGYLREHSYDAQKVTDTFEPNQIDPKVYDRAQRSVARLKSFESHK